MTSYWLCRCLQPTKIGSATRLVVNAHFAFSCFWQSAPVSTGLERCCSFVVVDGFAKGCVTRHERHGPQPLSGVVGRQRGANRQLVAPRPPRRQWPWWQRRLLSRAPMRVREDRSFGSKLPKLFRLYANNVYPRCRHRRRRLRRPSPWTIATPATACVEPPS